LKSNNVDAPPDDVAHSGAVAPELIVRTWPAVPFASLVKVVQLA
jgi:hypothetical protein